MSCVACERRSSPCRYPDPASVTGNTTRAVRLSRASSRQNILEAARTKEVNLAQPLPKLPPTAEIHDAELLEFSTRNLWPHYPMLDCDSTSASHSTMVRLARQPGNRALLCAILAFAVHHYGIVEGKIVRLQFHQYYDESLSLLQSMLSSHEYSIYTVLTVLHLATIAVSKPTALHACYFLTVGKEYLGHWNLALRHYTAAHHVFDNLKAEDCTVEQAVYAMTVAWLTRPRGIDAIYPHQIRADGMEWLLICLDDYIPKAKQKATAPIEGADSIEELFWKVRLLAIEVKLLADKITSAPTLDIFEDGIALQRRLEETNSELAREGGSDKDPKTDAMRTKTCLGIELLTLDLTLRTILAERSPWSHEDAFSGPTLSLCAMFEYLQAQLPSTNLAGYQASFAAAGLALPRSDVFLEWCRRQFSTIEGSG